jgi:tetratricopeptide (TPR) repeat protein
MTAIYGNNPLKDLLKEGRIQNLVLQDKEGGESCTFFGKITHEDKKNTELTDTASIKNIREGNEFLDQKRYEEAIQSYDKVLEKGSNINVLALKGVALEGLGKKVEALICYDQSLEIDPKNASVWKKKAFLLHDMNRYEEAIECFFKIPEIDLRAIHRTINKLMELKRFEEVVKCYDKILSVNDKDPQSWNNKGLVLYKCLNKHEEAIECFKKAADLDHADAIDNLKALGLR